jgi:predicted secreted protein
MTPHGYLISMGCNNNLIYMKSFTFEQIPDVIDVRLDETFIIDFPYTAGTGYRWDWVQPPEILKEVNRETIPLSDAAGAGLRLQIILKAVSKGKEKLKLKYWQPWSGEESIEKTVELDINIDD